MRALRDVGLDPETRFRYPHEFSGGQRQRIAVARAIVLEPTFVVLDEPTSALDMLIQAQIVDLLRDLQKRLNLTYLFISHDLRVVAALASNLIVMRHGKVVEGGPAVDLFAHPKSDYTRALFAAAFNLETAARGRRRPIGHDPEKSLPVFRKIMPDAIEAGRDWFKFGIIKLQGARQPCASSPSRPTARSPMPRSMWR